jgi:4-amino-4-deoxy-L-arabinose transferase-like glycosyltransferase
VQNVDEERFLGVALEMLHNGSWLIPHRAGEIYGDKPPIFMWTVAFFAWLTGKPNLALFIPGLFSAVTVTAMVYDLGDGCGTSASDALPRCCTWRPTRLTASCVPGRSTAF